MTLRDLRILERHAIDNLPERYRGEGGYVARMVEIDKAIVPKLGKYTQAEIVAWMCGRLSVWWESHTLPVPSPESRVPRGEPCRRRLR